MRRRGAAPRSAQALSHRSPRAPRVSPRGRLTCPRRHGLHGCAAPAAEPRFLDAAFARTNGAVPPSIRTSRGLPHGYRAEPIGDDRGGAPRRRRHAAISPASSICIPSAARYEYEEVESPGPRRARPSIPRAEGNTARGETLIACERASARPAGALSRAREAGSRGRDNPRRRLRRPDPWRS
jgi:hypothetical protein